MNKLFLDFCSEKSCFLNTWTWNCLLLEASAIWHCISQGKYKCFLDSYLLEFLAANVSAWNTCFIS